MRYALLLLLAAVMLTGCATNKKETPVTTEPTPTQATQSKNMSPATLSQLEQGKRLFKDGFYKRAMEQLLPLAAEGNMEAQYAVGYMYYYGFGAAQDTASGHFWVQRAADQHYEPAIKALAIMHKQEKTGKDKKVLY